MIARINVAPLDPAVAKDPRLNVGVFRGKVDGDRRYKAWLRFSNAANVPTDDRTKDFRGLAIKLFDVHGDKLPVPSGATTHMTLTATADDSVPPSGISTDG